MPDIAPGLVSTIIPVYNRPAMLREAVGSVLAQTHRPIEIIIVDDGSTDNTPRAGQSLAEERAEEIRFIRKANRGPGPAREAGRQLARGEFIQYLDSDDLLRPRKFEVQIAALRANPECDVAYGITRLVGLNGEVLADPFKWTGRPLRELFPGLLVDRWWCTHTPLYRRRVCDAIGPWTDLRWSQDWEYDGRVGALGTRLAYCPELVSEHRQHDGVRQISPANWMAPERLRARKRLLELLLGHAERAGVAPDTPERQHFTRWVFATARRCAAAGLNKDFRECMRLTKRAAAGCATSRRGLAPFEALCCLLGPRAAGRFALRVERLRRPGRLTLEQSFWRPDGREESPSLDND